MRIALAGMFVWLAAAAVAPAAGESVRKVAMRAAGGRFLRVAEEGMLRADRVFPAESELFELLAREGGAIALRAPGGRLLAAQPPEARTLRAASPRAEPGEWETFSVVDVEGNRVGLKARGFREFVRFTPEPPDKPAPPPSQAKTPEKPGRGETVEIFEAAEFPEALRTIVASTVRTFATAEVAKKEYHKTRTRSHQAIVRLPTPTREDLLRTKRERIASVTDEFEIRAQLDGPLEIELVHMPYLKGYRERGAARLLFDVRVKAPVRGHVRYHVENVLSASTGFRTTARLSLVAELAVRKKDAKLDVDAPSVLDLSVELSQLDLSNDVLQTTRKPIERFINHELRRNDDRIREQANNALAKALKTRQLESPILRYLAFP